MYPDPNPNLGPIINWRLELGAGGWQAFLPYAVIGICAVGVVILMISCCRTVPDTGINDASSRVPVWTTLWLHRPRPLYNRRRRAGKPLPDLGWRNDVRGQLQQFRAALKRVSPDTWFGWAIVVGFVLALTGIGVLGGYDGLYNHALQVLNR